MGRRPQPGRDLVNSGRIMVGMTLGLETQMAIVAPRYCQPTLLGRRRN